MDCSNWQASCNVLVACLLTQIITKKQKQKKKCQDGKMVAAEMKVVMRCYNWVTSSRCAGLPTLFNAALLSHFIEQWPRGKEQRCCPGERKLVPCLSHNGPLNTSAWRCWLCTWSKRVMVDCRFGQETMWKECQITAFGQSCGRGSIKGQKTKRKGQSCVDSSNS